MMNDGRYHLAACSILAIAMLGSAATEAPAQDRGPRVESKIDDPRVQHRSYKFAEAGGVDTPYALFVPSTYEAGRAAPLMIGLHGLGRSYDWLMGYHGLLDFAERDGFIVVTPLGHDRRGWFGSRDNGEVGELSAKDVMNVIALVREEFSVDPDRIYLWGHSMGGAGTYHLAIEHPDLFAALCVAAPAPSAEPRVLEAIRDVPILVLQGDQDRLALRTREWVAEMKKLGMEHIYVELAGGDHSLFISQNRAMMAKVFDFFNIVRKNETAPPSQ